MLIQVNGAQFDLLNQKLSIRQLQSAELKMRILKNIEFRDARTRLLSSVAGSQQNISKTVEDETIHSFADSLRKAYH
jgi:hypothetical protein